MLGVRLDPELEERLDMLARSTGRTKSYYAREAIREYVEDREDYELAVAASRDAGPSISLEELIRNYGLEDQLQQKSGKEVRKTRARSASSDRRIPQPARRRSA
jgi:RHH-type transcriptional regulator, rel operon repressor / antitoxin RelB